MNTIALPFADYMASAAVRLLEAILEADKALLAYDDNQNAATEAAHLETMDTRIERCTQLERTIYEYLKRRSAPPPMAKQMQAAS